MRLLSRMPPDSTTCIVASLTLMDGMPCTCTCTCPSFWTLWDRLRSKGDGGDHTAKNVNEKVDEKISTGTQLRYKVHKTSSSSQSSPELDKSIVIYKALWSFEARAGEELSFQEGDQFKIIERCGDWWKAEKIDYQGNVTTTGFVPYNYLAKGETVDAQLWYFGKLNRLESHNLLLAAVNGEGSFLVRRSEKDSVGYVLSVRVDEKVVKHFKVYQTEEGEFCVDPSHNFPGLEELVEHYRSHPLASTRLTEPCARSEPKPQDLSHTTVGDWELPKEQFTLMEQLGDGYFAEVYRGKWKGLVNVAIKVLKNVDSLDHRAFQAETQMLKKLRHRHLISLFAICTATPPFYIITELMEKGNLLLFLRGQEGRSLDLISLIDMATQVADGMCYLEEQNSIHRDLAARNVLVGENCICKVADFGLARVIKEPFYISEDKMIPYKWSAPEAISHGHFSNKSDVWSFGILLYEILTYGGTPYPKYSNNEVFRLISSGYRMPAPPKCPSHIYDIMRMCWSGPVAERPDFSELRHLLENISRHEMDWSAESGSESSNPPEGSSATEQPDQA